ncbi:hypothetical protein ACSBOX_05815 [Arthrobacter sp. KN11-1C]|uniref:hypothetical protein n=1 Tax=Arthrobacter sp. KN11-1C TaxID=3445774 RepID=UPI003F9F4874
MSMTMDPRACFPHFYTNPAVRLLETFPRWTVSGRLGDDTDAKAKAPIDTRALLESGRVRGAWAVDENCLVTLGELTQLLPAAANAAFYLRAPTDGLLVIDIEASCPAEISANLLALPGILYAETSMSGRGYHIVTGLPENFYEHGVAASKRVLRESHGWYEILLDHWVTFTREPISEEIMVRARNTDLASAPFGSVDDLYSSLAETARAATATSAEVNTSATVPDITGSQEIVGRTLAGAAARFKTLEQFGGDNSRFEFSVLGVLYREMRSHLVRYGFINRVTYSPDDQAWMLYQAALQALPSRPKHNELRNGRPFLLDRAAAMIATA